MNLHPGCNNRFTPCFFLLNILARKLSGIRVEGEMKTARSENGYLLIEIMVSMVLVLIAVSALGRILEHTIRSGRASAQRLRHDQSLNSWRDRLLTADFNHAWMSAGTHREMSEELRLNWKVADLSPDLKQIELTIRCGALSARQRFHKSFYIHGSGWKERAVPKPGEQP